MKLTRDKAVTIISYAMATTLLISMAVLCPWLAVGFFLGYAMSKYANEIKAFLEEDEIEEDNTETTKEN